MERSDIIVQKYGGTSVEGIEKIKKVAQRIKNRKEKGYSIVVVVSAMGNSTDQLIELANGVSKNPPHRELDVLLSTGEQVTISLLAMALNEIKVPAVSFTGAQVGIKTTGFHTKSRIKDIDDKKILDNLMEGNVVIIAGFQGINDKYEITTLGRGGSDTTAVAIAAKLQCPCEIYTDVPGIFTVNPKLYPYARKLDKISYEEILEMSSLGAQVMHSRSIEIGQKYGIPIYVGISNGEEEGTLIDNESGIEGSVVTGLAVKNDEAMITIKNIDGNIAVLDKIFKIMADKDINIDMISQTAPIDGKTNLSFTLPKRDMEEALKGLTEIGYGSNDIDTMEDISKVSVVGIGMRSQPGVASTFFSAINKENIQVKMVTTSEIKISCIIKAEDELRAVTSLARAFKL